MAKTKTRQTRLQPKGWASGNVQPYQGRTYEQAARVSLARLARDYPALRHSGLGRRPVR